MQKKMNVLSNLHNMTALLAFAVKLDQTSHYLELLFASFFSMVTKVNHIINLPQ